MNMNEISSKRVLILTGHYGSGKTNLAVNLALGFSASGEQVSLADLDIVNPYFRAADSTRLLTDAGVKVVAPVYAGTNLDIPALSPQFYGLFSDHSRRVILDVGGDDAGAAALGRYAREILQEDDFEHFYVVNARRILTQKPEEAVAILREIEAAGHVPVTAVVNNTNLANETDAGILRESDAFAKEVARAAGLPLRFTSAVAHVAQSLGDLDNILPVRIFVKTPWDD